MIPLCIHWRSLENVSRETFFIHSSLTDKYFTTLKILSVSIVFFHQIRAFIHLPPRLRVILDVQQHILLRTYFCVWFFLGFLKILGCLGDQRY
jgi:hypothetical protein